MNKTHRSPSTPPTPPHPNVQLGKLTEQVASISTSVDTTDGKVDTFAKETVKSMDEMQEQVEETISTIGTLNTSLVKVAADVGKAASGGGGGGSSNLITNSDFLGVAGDEGDGWIRPVMSAIASYQNLVNTIDHKLLFHDNRSNGSEC